VIDVKMYRVLGNILALMFSHSLGGVAMVISTKGPAISRFFDVTDRIIMSCRDTTLVSRKFQLFRM